MKSEVNLEKVSYEKVMRMNEKMMIRRGGVLVLVIGLGKLKKSEWEWDWEEVEKKNGMIIREKKKWSWWNGKIYYCVVSEEEKSYAKKWLNNVVESMYGTIEEVERKENPIEEDESFQPLKELVEEGNVEAMFHMANFYFVPDGPLKQDYVRARELYENVCRRVEANKERSYKEKRYLAMSKTQLGFIYEQGLGVERDMNRAFYLFRWAARKGRIPQAMYNLGLMYMTGGEVWEQDMKEAEQWITLAERKNIPQAKAVLKRMQHGDVTDQMPLQDPTLTEAKVSNAYFTWQIVSVRCNQEGTHVVKSCTPKVCGTYIYSDGNEVLIDSTTGERYGIIQSELPPTQREAWILRDTQTVYFRELYPPLKSTTKALDINNGNDEYYIRNWQIRTEIKQ